MEKYYVHTETDKQGDHEVHMSTCSWLPKLGHRELLGLHEDCFSAVEEAESQGFKPANGCKHCSEECHTT